MKFNDSTYYFILIYLFGTKFKTTESSKGGPDLQCCGLRKINTIHNLGSKFTNNEIHTTSPT
jgi:hypothetical protein